jgi:hypothetical protein
MVIRNELLRDHPNVVLEDVARFLSISPFPSVEHREVHSRSYPVKLRENELTFLYTFYKDEINSLEKLLDWDLTSWKE